jgi:hypothetical protein
VAPKTIVAPPLFEQAFENIYESQGTERQAFDTSDIAPKKFKTGVIQKIWSKGNGPPEHISNAENFEVIDDYLITGYGFTAEPDYIYVLRRKTGKAIQKIKIKSGPDYIIRKNNDIYVRAYDTDYVFRIQRKK